MPVGRIEPVAEASVVARRASRAEHVCSRGEPGVAGAKFDSVGRASVFMNGGGV